MGWSDEKRVKIVGVVKILSNICTVKYCQLDKLIKLVSVILFKIQENLGWMVATGYLIVLSSKIKLYRTRTKIYERKKIVFFNI